MNTRMPLILIIVGVIAALGFGGFLFMHGPEGGDVEVVTPIARVTDTSTVLTDETSAETIAQDTSIKTGQGTVPVPDTIPVATLPTTTVSAPVVTPQATTAAASTYKNGTYTVTTSYVAPGRSTHTVTTAVTIADDLVTNTILTFGGDSVDASKSWQSKFSSAYQTQVIGKKLDDISLSRVGGASLTTNAFNKALAEVKGSAQL